MSSKNSIAIMIANTSKGQKTGQFIPVIDEYVEDFQNIFTNYGIENYVLKDLNKDEFFSTLKELGDYVKKKKIGRVFLIHNGHSSESATNKLAQFKLADTTDVLLTDITKYFKDSKYLYFLFDGCRVSKAAANPNYQVIPNQYFVLSHGVQFTCGSRGYLTDSFLNKLDKFLSINVDIFDLKSYLILLEYAYLDYLKEDKGIPNIYANRNVRNEYPELYQELLDLTGQLEEEAKFTVINEMAQLRRDFNLYNELLSDKISECDILESDLEYNEQRLNELMARKKRSVKEISKFAKLDTAIRQKLYQCKEMEKLLNEKIDEIENRMKEIGLL